MRDRLLQIAVGRGQNPDVDDNAPGAADRTDFLLLNGAQQLGLQIHRQFAHFVEKHRAALGNRQQAFFGLHRAGKSSLHIAEELAFDEGGNERTTVHGNEWLVAVGTGEMDGARNDLFAGAALAEDQYGMVALGRLGDDPVEPFHLRRATDNPAEALFRFDLLPQNAVLTLQFQVAGDPFKKQLQFFYAEGLGHVVVGASFHRLHRRVHGAVAGHHDDHRIGTPLPDLAQSVEPSRPRQLQVQQHHVDALRLQLAIGVFGGIGDHAVEAERLRHFAAHVADGALIVDDHEVQKIGWLDLGRVKDGGCGCGHGCFPLFEIRSVSVVRCGVALTG